MTERILKMKAAGLILVIFTAGLVAGMAIFRLMSPPLHFPGPPPGPPGPEFVLRSFADSLNLSDEQVTGVRKVLENNQKDAKEIFAKVQPALESSFNEARQHIRALLNESQAKQFDRMVEEWQRIQRPDLPPSPGPQIIPHPAPPGPPGPPGPRPPGPPGPPGPPRHPVSR